MKPDRNEVHFDDITPASPWAVVYGRMTIARLPTEAEAGRVALKLNQLLDRRSPARMVLDVLNREMAKG